MREKITPLILTFNEAPNIGRTVEQLGWADEVIVIDSFSTDETLEILGQFRNVRVIQRVFDDHTSQWNFGLEQVISDWVLSLDADYILDANFIAEIAELPLSSTEITAWFARIDYCITGRRLRSSLYPPRAVLFRKSRCKYIEDGHTQLLETNGSHRMLRSAILHDDRKSFSRWLNSQQSYVCLEARKLLTANDAELDWNDRLRKKIVLAPLLMGVYALFVKRLILDGWPGIFYAMQRVYAELLLSLELLDRRVNREDQAK